MPLRSNTNTATPCYRRQFFASVDNIDDARVRVRGTLSDPGLALSYDWTVSIPDYTILHASVEDRSKENRLLSPQLSKKAEGIAGSSVNHGFTRIMRGVLGDLPGHHEHLTLGIEMARVSLQVFPLPKDDHERFAAAAAEVPPGPSRLARMLWERDRTDFGMLSNSCFAYRDESAELFHDRTVEPFDPTMTSPEHGQVGFFSRIKKLSIRRLTDVPGFRCDNEMSDTFQEMRIGFEIDYDGVINRAESTPGRVPFRGICEMPHGSTGKLNGLRLTRSFVASVGDRIGGPNGCTHLFDLATDCLRLFEWQD